MRASVTSTTTGSGSGPATRSWRRHAAPSATGICISIAAHARSASHAKACGSTSAVSPRATRSTTAHRSSRAHGIRHAVVGAGGDSRMLGDRCGRPWTVGIRDPRNEGEVVALLPLEDVAVSTSGDYERYFDDGDERCHHLIDPRTGRSPNSIRSVTVIAPDGLTSEALSKTVFVLGVEQGARDRRVAAERRCRDRRRRRGTALHDGVAGRRRKGGVPMNFPPHGVTDRARPGKRRCIGPSSRSCYGTFSASRAESTPRRQA